MKESDFQKSLIKEIEMRFPGCYILKNDPNYIQGIPDLLVLYGPYWAMLEVKASAKATRRPNQRYRINELNELGGFASFVYPENKEVVLDDMARSFET